MNALKTLFLNELADMYDAEQQITKALPKMIKAATCEQLRDSLQDHLRETESQKTKLERVFAAFNEPPRAKKCAAIVGILEEGGRIVAENQDSSAINAAIIAAAQKVEHYEIASYGTLHAWADLMGYEEAADVLESILDQEKAADSALNDLAVTKNQEAMEEVEAGSFA